MNLGLQFLQAEFEEKEKFVKEKYIEIKDNFWWAVGKFHLMGTPMSNEHIAWFKKVFDEIEDDPTAINKYFLAKRGGEKFGELNGVDCKLDTSIKEFILFGIEDEAKLLIGQNEMAKKLQGKPYNKDLYEAFSTPDSTEMRQLADKFEMHKGGVSKL